MKLKIPEQLSKFIKSPKKKLQLSFGHRLARVIKHPGGFTCGMCAAQYNSLNEAWSCIINDVAKLEDLPLSIESVNGGEYCACLTCGKSYPNKQDAAICMSNDTNQSKMPPSLKNNLYELVTRVLNGKIISKRDDMVTRPRIIGVNTFHSSFNKMNNAAPQKPDPVSTELAEQEKNQAQKRRSAVQTGNDSPHVIPEVFTHNVNPPGSNVTFNSSITEPNVPKPILKRKPGQQPFLREDAKYVCNVCYEKFYTKSEAETHYMTHPLV